MHNRCILNAKGFLAYSMRLALMAAIHTRRHTARDHVPANTILLLDTGWSVPQVAEEMFLDEDSIRNFFIRDNTGKNHPDS